MTRMHRPLRVAAVVVISGVLLAGCKATGGGWIPSATGDGKAHFGFVWQTTEDPDKTLAKGTWHDGDVRLRLVDGVILTFPFGGEGCAIGFAEYVSQSKARPGSGTLTIQLCDLGEPGPTNGDFIGIVINSGPYEGYTNEGVLQGGNLQIKGDGSFFP